MALVLLHLADTTTLAEVVRCGDQDRLDLRTLLVYSDGHTDALEIFGSRRGVEDGQWEELPGEVLPVLEVAPVEERRTEPVVPPPPIPPPALPTVVALD